MPEFHQPLAVREEIRQEKYEPLKQAVERVVAEITGEDPERWLARAEYSLKKIGRAASEYPPEIQEFLNDHLEKINAILRSEYKREIPEELEDPTTYTNERIRSVIHEVSDLLLLKDQEQQEVEVRHMSYEQVLESKFAHGYKLQEVTDGSLTKLEIFSPTQDKWFAFPLPQTERMMHKGGFPRVILKLLSDAPIETIEAELPPNDFDVIAWGDEQEAYRVASDIGVDLSGVEILAKEPDFSTFLTSRDVDGNACLFGKNGLIFSDAAKEAAETGYINPIPSYRGIYGTNMLKYEGESLYSGRDMMRAAKFVAEGKAVSFSFSELNGQIDMGIYALVLAEKFLNKKGFSEALLDKTFYLLKQMGQVEDGETDIWQTLDRIHSTYPFMDMNRRTLPSDTEVSEWLLGKVGKQALHTFKKTHHIPSALELTPVDGHKEPNTISLTGYAPDQKVGSLENIEALEQFLSRCGERTGSQA